MLSDLVGLLSQTWGSDGWSFVLVQPGACPWALLGPWSVCKLFLYVHCFLDELWESLRHQAIVQFVLVDLERVLVHRTCLLDLLGLVMPYGLAPECRRLNGVIQLVRGDPRIILWHLQVDRLHQINLIMVISYELDVLLLFAMRFILQLLGFLWGELHLLWQQVLRDVG